LSPAAGNTWKYNLLHVFGKGEDGFRPSAPVLVTATGTLFGTADAGGAQGDGVVFEISY
jgi:uncharacterized repeat protein (TIGR03803 family)